MTIAELIEALQEFAEEHGENTEVRLAQQPSWPFEYSIDEVVAVSSDSADEDEDETEKPIVYIGEGRQLGYLPGIVSRELGWRE